MDPARDGQGRPFVRNVCMALDLRLCESADDQVFSMTV